jgi:hypothetical protein
MPAKPTGDRPARVALNLDKIEREGRPEQFAYIHDGHHYTATDAQDIDWQELVAALQNPRVFFRLVLAADDADRFLASKLPTWKMRRLMDAYRDHYGLLDPGEAPASRTS